MHVLFAKCSRVSAQQCAQAITETSICSLRGLCSPALPPEIACPCRPAVLFRQPAWNTIQHCVSDHSDPAGSYGASLLARDCLSAQLLAGCLCYERTVPGSLWHTSRYSDAFAGSILPPLGIILPGHNASAGQLMLSLQRAANHASLDWHTICKA